MVQIAFYKADKAKKHRWLTKLIAWWTGGEFCHCEIIIDGFMYSSSNWDGGVRKKKWNGAGDKWVVIPVLGVDKQKILDFYKETKEEKYDYLGILGFVLPFKDREKQWFCSEWVSNALKIAGCKKLWLQEPSKISPNKLYKILKG